MIPSIRLKSGRTIPRLGLGTWMIGGDFKRDSNNADDMQMQGIKMAIDNGVRLIRTAQNYADGYCETLIGKAISSVERKQLYIIVSANEFVAVDEKTMMQELKGSLSRLGICDVDMFIMGGINQQVSQKKIAKGLLNILDSGLARDIGVGNYRLPEFEYLDGLTSGKIAYNELHYNLIIREPETIGLLDEMKKRGVIVGAYRPLQFGQLAKPGINILDKMAAKYGKSQAQVSLKWVVSHDGVMAITKAIAPPHIKEMAETFEWEMAKDDLIALTKDFPVQIQASDCIPPIMSFTK